MLAQGLEPYCTALLNSLACSESFLFWHLLVQKLACSETCLFRHLLVQGLEPYCIALLHSLIAQPYCTALLHCLIAQPWCTALLDSLIEQPYFIKGTSYVLCLYLHIVHMILFQLTRVLHNTGISRIQNARFARTSFRSKSFGKLVLIVEPMNIITKVYSKFLAKYV